MWLQILLIGCQSNQDKLDLNFQVKGLKKGKIILKKLNDSSFFEIDSFSVKGNEFINFTYDLKEPQILFLDLAKRYNLIRPVLTGLIAGLASGSIFTYH